MGRAVLRISEEYLRGILGLPENTRIRHARFDWPGVIALIVEHDDIPERYTVEGEEPPLANAAFDGEFRMMPKFVSWNVEP